MIAIEDVENHIISNTNEKMVSCLRLSGFRSFVDYMIFTETTVSWIEKYIGIRCSLMNVDQRTEYIDEYFLNSPEKYMFPVPLRHRLINAISDLHRESERLMQTINDNNQVKNTIPDPVLPTDNEHLEYNSDSANPSKETSPEISQIIKQEVEDTKVETLPAELHNFRNICRQQKIESIDEKQRKFYEEIVQFASEEFIECYLIPTSDFDLVLPDLETETYRFIGRYNCLICDYTMKKRSTVLFKIQNNGKIQFAKIKKHLADHFTLNPDANDIRKQNRLLKRKSNNFMKNPASIIQYDMPADLLAAQANVVPNRKFLPAQKKKMYSLLNEILPKPQHNAKQISHAPVYNQIIHQSDSIAAEPERLEVKKVLITDYQVQDIHQSQIEEHIDTAEVVIEHTTTDNASETYQSDSDIEESNLTICT